MNTIKSIVLHEEQSSKKVELISGQVVEKSFIEEGISACQGENFKFKRLKYEEQNQSNAQPDQISALLNEYTNIKGLYILYENKSVWRTVYNQDDYEQTKKTEYSEIVIASTEYEKNNLILSYGITNRLLSTDIVAFQANLYTRYLQERKEFISLKSGIYDVIMYPEVMGVLVHEIIGHLCEADNHLNNNYSQYRIGYDFGFPITVYDDPYIPNAWGSISIDDEGNKSEKVILVDRGILKNYMTSNSTSDILKLGNNGHARCTRYDKKPIVRMTNTVMQPGKQNKDEMIEGMQEGIIARMTKGGYMYKDFFGITIIDGSYIKDGSVRTITNCVIRGRICDIVNHITHISSETEMMSGRGCVKLGQGLLPVSVTAPYVTFKSLYIEQR